MRQNERHLITLEKEGNSISVSYFRAVCLCGFKSEPGLEDNARRFGWTHLGQKKEEVDTLGMTQASLTKRMIYLASPHTHISSGVRWDRYKAARDCLDWLTKNKFWVFSPIVHCHNLPMNEGTDWEYWKELDTEFITRMDELWVLIMPGTKESKGVRAEIKIAEIQGKKIIAISKDVGEGYITEKFEYHLLDR